MKPRRQEAELRSYMIIVTPEDRRALRLPWSALISNKGGEFWTKFRGQRIKGQGMIGASSEAVACGFGGLEGADFDEYNFPQVWVERRQIPGAISGRIPARGAVVLDLGCGPGTSTEILAYFADPSWTIIGYDLTRHLVERARLRAARGEFRSRNGCVITPEFECQNVADPLRGLSGLIRDSSVDFAISCGVVGLYLQRDEAARLAVELARVVKSGGFAAIDTGPANPVSAVRELMSGAGFDEVGVARSFVVEPRPKLVFRRR